MRFNPSYFGGDPCCERRTREVLGQCTYVFRARVMEVVRRHRGGVCCQPRIPDVLSASRKRKRKRIREGRSVVESWRRCLAVVVPILLAVVQGGPRSRRKRWKILRRSRPRGSISLRPSPYECTVARAMMEPLHCDEVYRIIRCKPSLMDE